MHTHVFPLKIAEKASRSIGAFYGGPPGKLASIDVLLEDERRAGIRTVLISNSAVNAGQVPGSNTFLAETCAAHPGLFGLGSLFPGMPNWEEELDRLTALGLRGVKIHPDFQHVPIDLPEAVPMYREIARRGLVVLFHMGDPRYDYSSPERLRNLKRQVPDLLAIAAHFGGYLIWEDSLRCPQPEGIWYDTASTLMFVDPDLAKRMMDRFGAERFLFGSDFPMWTPSVEVNRFLNFDLGLTYAEKEAILYHNFARLFRL